MDSDHFIGAAVALVAVWLLLLAYLIGGNMQMLRIQSACDSVGAFDIRGEGYTCTPQEEGR